MVVLEEEGVKLEHKSFIALVKGVKLIQLFSRFVLIHKTVEGKKCLKLLAVRTENKETRAVVTHVVLRGLSSRLQFESFPPVTKLGRKRTVEHKNITEDTMKKPKQSLQLEREK